MKTDQFTELKPAADQDVKTLVLPCRRLRLMSFIALIVFRVRMHLFRFIVKSVYKRIAVKIMCTCFCHSCSKCSAIVLRFLRQW